MNDDYDDSMDIYVWKITFFLIMNLRFQLWVLGCKIYLTIY